MKTNIEDIKKIEAYLDNELTAEERQAFEEQLHTNKGLKKELEIHQHIRKSFELQGKKYLEGQLEHYYNNFKTKEKKHKRLRVLWPAMAVAASIVLFFTLHDKQNTVPDAGNNFITIDSVRVDTMDEHADSATYKNENGNIDLE